MKNSKVAWLVIKELTIELELTRRELQKSRKEHVGTIARDADRCRKLSEELDSERAARAELQKERDEILAEVKILRLDMKNRSVENDILLESNRCLNKELNALQVKTGSKS